MFKKKRYVAASIIIVLFVFMWFTTPSNTEFDQWLIATNGLDCNSNQICSLDNIMISSSTSNLSNFGVYATYEKEFGFENGEKLTVRTLGVFNKMLTIEDERVWEIID